MRHGYVLGSAVGSRWPETDHYGVLSGDDDGESELGLQYEFGSGDDE